MKIIILGAGQVGGTLAEHLADEQNAIPVVAEHAAPPSRVLPREGRVLAPAPLDALPS